MIGSRNIENIRGSANIMNANEFCFARTIRLTMLSPEIIDQAIRGTLPADIGLTKLYKLPIIHKLITGEADISMQTLRRSFLMILSKLELKLL